jgi:orotate phosphoribosyltransferase
VTLIDAHSELITLLQTRALRRGDFVLSSGKRSNFYIDARLATMSGHGQRLIGNLGLAALDDADWQPRSIGGLTLGADPVAYAIAHAAASANRQLDAFTVRKEAKAHGTGRLIEGNFEAGWPVVIIEDVITTGGSALRAAEAVREAGGDILGVLAVVDRQEGGVEKIRVAGYDVRALVTVEELLR